MKRILIILVVAVVVVATTWAALRYFEYRREESLRSGIGALKRENYAEALTKIAPYAREGHRLAQELMGLMHARGLGVPVDNIRAQIWIRRLECKCDRPGRSEASLGHDYLRSGPKDATRALYWFQRAAEAGDIDSQRLLANPQEAAKRGLVILPQVVEYWREFLKRPE